MKTAFINSNSSCETAADRALFFLCDAGISLMLAVFALVVTLLVWCPLELIQQSLHGRNAHGTQGGRV